MDNRDQPIRKVVALSTDKGRSRARGRGTALGRGRVNAVDSISGGLGNVAAPSSASRGDVNATGSISVDLGNVAGPSSAGRGRGRGRGRGKGVFIDGNHGMDVLSSSVGRGGRGGRGRGRGRGTIGSGSGLRSVETEIQATSSNLPVILYASVAEYFVKLRVPEQRQSKDSRSAKSHYGDNAIGYVKLQRSGSNCKVEARVTPETNVNNTAYFVMVTIDEITKDIIATSCNCQGSKINCKHQTALIFWLLRRSEEPSPTDIICYWKKSVLSTVKNIKSKTVDDLSNHNTNLLGITDNLLKEFIEIGKDNNKDAGVIRYSKYGMKKTLYMDHLMIEFLENQSMGQLNCENFVAFYEKEMSDDMCKQIFEDTKEQSSKSQWYYLRFGRITASKLFEVSRCLTIDGSLVSSVMGSRGFKGNAATIRGQKLEAEIFKLLKCSKYPTIEKSGIIVRSDMPIFGASPDGLTSEYVFEIKCPSKKKTVENYIKDGLPSEKVFYQMQLQMAMSGRNKGVLVVADPDFESNLKFTEVEVPYNKKLLDDAMKKCKIFWKNVIFKILK